MILKTESGGQRLAVIATHVLTAAFLLSYQAFESFILVEQLGVPVFEVVQQILFSSSVVACTDTIFDEDVLLARHQLS